jgi:hypothetical protein
VALVPPLRAIHLVESSIESSRDARPWEGCEWLETAQTSTKTSTYLNFMYIRIEIFEILQGMGG